jgi:hypothetical protein
MLGTNKSDSTITTPLTDAGTATESTSVSLSDSGPGTDISLILSAAGEIRRLRAGSGIKIQALATAANIEVDLAASPSWTGSHTFSNNITMNATPTLPQHLVTKAYVDASSAGLIPTQQVRVATIADLGATYNSTGGASLTGSFTSAPTSVDSVSLVDGDRILVKDQTLPAQNGIYEAVDAASGIWQRASDADTTGEVVQGLYTLVSEGSTNSGNGFVIQRTSGTITVGTPSGSSIVWTQFNSVNNYIAGDGLDLSGLTFSVDSSDIVGDGLEDDGSNNLQVKPYSVVDTNIAPTTVTSDGVGVSVRDLNGDHLPVDYSPTNYTPTTSAPHSDQVTDLTSHLNGINSSLNRSLGGDLTGVISTPTVAKIRGITVSTTAPTTGQVLAYNGTQYVPTAFTQTTKSGSGTAVINTFPHSIVVTHSLGAPVRKIELIVNRIDNTTGWAPSAGIPISGSATYSITSTGTAQIASNGTTIDSQSHMSSGYVGRSGKVDEFIAIIGGTEIGKLSTLIGADITLTAVTNNTFTIQVAQYKTAIQSYLNYHWRVTT